MLRFDRIREQGALTEAMVNEGRHCDRPLNASRTVLDFPIYCLSGNPPTNPEMPPEDSPENVNRDERERLGDRIWRRVRRAIYDAVHTILGPPPADVADMINDVLDQAKRDWCEEQRRGRERHDAPGPQPEHETND